MATSNHYRNTRNKRERLIQQYCNGDGCMIEGFVVDRGHKHGTEVHSITDTGLIIIHNYRTNRLVTKLIARPQQIARYYKSKDVQPPRYLMELAQWHQDMMYNYV